MSSEPLIDIIPIMRREQDGAIITQFDYPTCETLGLIKMDFLGLRNLTVLDDALTQHRRQPRRAGRPARTLPLDDQATYELLARGDTLGRLPARRRADALAAAADAPGQLRGHLRGRSRSTGPGPMGANSHTNYALRKNGRRPIDADPPRARRAARPRSSDTTYGLIVYQEQVMAIAQKVAGLHASARPTCCAGRWARRRRRSSTRSSSRFSEGMQANGYSDGGDQDAVGHPASRSPTTPSTRRTPPAYGLVSYWTAYLKANYPAEYMAALLTSRARRQGQVGALPQRVPPDGHQGAAARRQRVRRRTSPRSAPTSGSASTAIRNVGANVVDAIVAAREEKGAVRSTSTTSCDKVPPVVCNKRIDRVADQGRRVRLARRTPAAGWSPSTSGRRQRRRRSSARRRSARTRCSAASATTPAATFGGAAARSPTSRVGQADAARPSSARCSASTSPTTRCSGSSTSSPAAADCSIASLTGDDAPPDGTTVTIAG